MANNDKYPKFALPTLASSASPRLSLYMLSDTGNIVTDQFSARAPKFVLHTQFTSSSSSLSLPSFSKSGYSLVSFGGGKPVSIIG